MTEIPKAGLYGSVIDFEVEFIVEDVWTSKPEDEEYSEGFFLVQMVEASGMNDMGAMGYELDPRE